MNERRNLFAALAVLIFICLAAIVIVAFLFSLSRPQLQASLSPPTLTPTPLLRGEQLYNANCFVCHQGAEGGQMMDYPPRHNANGHTWHHPDCELTDVILNGGDEMTTMMRQMMNIPDSVARMPAWKDKLSRAEIAEILTFIKTMWTEEQRGAQARVTQAQC